MKFNLKSPFLKSITILASGSIIAQIITLAASPILTRLYTPQEMGAYTFILTIITMFSGIICGRYDMSIVMEEDEKNIYPLIKLSLIICVFMSLMISAGYVLYIVFWNGEFHTYVYTVVFVFVILITKGITLILASYNNRRKEYSLMTSVYVIRATAQNLGMVSLGLLKFSIPGLLFSYTAGQLLGMNRQAKSLKPRLNEVKGAKISELLEAAKKHYKQPLYSVPALFANSFSYSSVNFFVQALFGTAILGLYSISFSVLGVPLSIISGNVAAVFFEEASREYNRTGKFINTLKKTTLFLTILSIIMVLCMIFLVPPLFGAVFGQRWAAAGTYVKILALMFGIRFIVTTLTPGILVAKKQNYELFIQILFIIMSVTGFLVSKFFSMGINGFLIFISAAFSIVYILYFIIIYKCSKGNIVTKVFSLN